MNRMQDRRSAFRLDVATQAICRLSSGEQVITGAIRDISIAGLFVITDERTAVGTGYDVEIILAGRHSRMVIEKMAGSVARCNGNGLAIKFAKRFEWFALVPLYFHTTSEYRE